MALASRAAIRETDGFWHVPRNIGPLVLERIRHLRAGCKMQDLPEELWHKSFRYYVKEDANRQGGPNLRLIRLDPEKPSLTVTAYIFNKFAHPFEDRFITPREAARLQDFPDDFLFRGNLTSVQRQIGNAVPIKLAAAIAEAVLQHSRMHQTLDRFGSLDQSPCLSLFTGIGGLDAGFEAALRARTGQGFKFGTYIELDSDCCQTLHANGFQNLRPCDITGIESPRSFWRRIAGCAATPLIIGGPPCQSFSQAGRQKGESDERGKLIYEFVRFVSELKPVYFVLENVSNLRGVAKGAVFRKVVASFQNLGYNLRMMKLCAADYGTAQRRIRMFIIGVLKPFPPVSPPKPTHCDPAKSGCVWGMRRYRTVADAFAGLPAVLTAS